MEEIRRGTVGGRRGERGREKNKFAPFMDVWKCRFRWIKVNRAWLKTAEPVLKNNWICMIAVEIWTTEILTLPCACAILAPDHHGPTVTLILLCAWLFVVCTVLFVTQDTRLFSYRVHVTRSWTVSWSKEMFQTSTYFTTAHWRQTVMATYPTLQASTDRERSSIKPSKTRQARLYFGSCPGWYAKRTKMDSVRSCVMIDLDHETSRSTQLNMGVQLLPLG